MRVVEPMSAKVWRCLRWALPLAMAAFVMWALTGCGGDMSEGDAADEPVPQQEEIGQAEQGWTINYRSGRIIGTAEGNRQNLSCFANQVASNECFLVRPNPTYMGSSRTYVAYTQGTASWGTYGTNIVNALNTAASNITSDCTVYAGFPGQAAPCATITVLSALNGSQCRVVSGGFTAPVGSTKVNDYMKITFFGTGGGAVTESPPYPGTWRTASYAEIAIDAGSLKFIPGINFDDALRQIIAAGLFGCIGMGQDKDYAANLYTCNKIQAAVYNKTDYWSGGCEQKFAYFYSAPTISDGTPTNVSFTANTGSCVMP